MPRAIAIFLIAIHLMNIIGYYGIIVNLENHHQSKITDRLDEGKFAGSDAIVLRIPFTLPYHSDNQSYERVNGRIEYEGDVYHLLKQKFHNDTLFIVCVRDAQMTEYKDAYKNLAQSMQDVPQGKSAGKITHLQIKDYETCSAIQISVALFPLEFLRLPEYSFSAILNTQSPPEQPPKA